MTRTELWNPRHDPHVSRRAGPPWRLPKGGPIRTVCGLPGITWVTAGGRPCPACYFKAMRVIQEFPRALGLTGAGSEGSIHRDSSPGSNA